VLDLLIRGGKVVDGSGGPTFQADIAMHDGEVVEMGRIRDKAREVIDADGLVVAPGFIDVHTHYDAQVFWDPILTPSSLHGVTTVIGGNCGFTAAPIDGASTEYVMRMLARVEGMPLSTLQEGLDWKWNSTAEFFDRLEGAVGINIGFLVGHSTVRRLVMGSDATERYATERELDHMKALVRAGLAAGALGFSSSLGLPHQDAEGLPVPSRHASREEIISLAGVCREFAGTSLEFIPIDNVDISDEQIDVMVSMSVAAGRPLNWNVLRFREAQREQAVHDLRAGRLAQQKGGRVVALTMPIPSRARFSFATGAVLDALPGWASTMALPHNEKLAALRDASVRAKLEASGKTASAGFREIANWDAKVIAEGFSPAAQAFENRRVGDIAKEQRKTAFNTLLDIVCDDDLRTTFSYGQAELSRADWEANVEVWRSGHACIGASDAGAHVDFTGTYDYPVYVIENAVRRHGVISLEEGVHLLTEVPAQLYGLKGRGRLKVGSRGDAVIFDDTSVATGDLSTRFDMPSGAGRLYSEPTGVSHVLVNGTHVIDAGEVINEHCGRLIRAGQDTTTPSLRVESK
jgi:N-acyl-D-aspartate/D-glutamate deacylase